MSSQVAITACSITPEEHSVKNRKTRKRIVSDDLGPSHVIKKQKRNDLDSESTGQNQARVNALEDVMKVKKRKKERSRTVDETSTDIGAGSEVKRKKSREHKRGRDVEPIITYIGEDAEAASGAAGENSGVEGAHISMYMEQAIQKDSESTKDGNSKVALCRSYAIINIALDTARDTPTFSMRGKRIKNQETRRIRNETEVVDADMRKKCKVDKREKNNAISIEVQNESVPDGDKVKRKREKFAQKDKDIELSIATSDSKQERKKEKKRKATKVEKAETTEGHGTIKRKKGQKTDLSNPVDDVFLSEQARKGELHLRVLLDADVDSLYTRASYQ